MYGDDVKARLRHKLSKILEDCNRLIADTKSIGARYPDMAREMAPDEWADMYTRRQWAEKALAALAADEPIPPPPE